MSQGEYQNQSPLNSLGLPDDEDNFEFLIPQIRATLDDLDLQSCHVEADYFNEDDENKTPVPRFGSQVGLFAKFTNAPTLDEFALANLISQEGESPRKRRSPRKSLSPKKRESSPRKSISPKKRFSGAPLMVISEELSPQIHTLLSFQGSEYDNPEFESIVSKRHKHRSWYRASLVAVIFSTQFAGALELVYISPMFTRMKLPPLLDATVWIFPVIFITVFTPFINIFSSHLKHQRITHFIMMMTAFGGSFLFAFIDQLIPFMTTDPETARLWNIYLGFIAFCLLDTSNEMTMLIQNKVIQADSELEAAFNANLTSVSILAKILAYFCGSLRAFGVDFRHSIISHNMDLGFILAGMIVFFSLLMTMLFQTAPTKGYRGPILNKFKQLKTFHFLPPIRQISKATPKLKQIISSHFFGAGGILMFTVYATLWFGANVFEGDPRAPEDSDDYQLFLVGMSWGSFCLFISAILAGLTKFLIYRATRPQNLNKRMIKYLYIIPLFVASLAIISTRFASGSIFACFIIIPLVGPALETFHIIPGLLADIAEFQETGRILGRYRHLLGFSLFYAQVMMFLVVPLCFLFFPERNDNQWGMLAAGSSALVGSAIGYFI